LQNQETREKKIDSTRYCLFL